MRLGRQVWALVVFISILAAVFHLRDKAGSGSESEIISGVIGQAMAFIFMPVLITYIVIGVVYLVKDPLSDLTRRTVFLSTWGLWTLALLIWS
jgi:hypothetical protein